jgi:pyruvate/2-oxoglutarate dehydrogenase complex dihydrolipoamide acyltransferase (E2) component
MTELRLADLGEGLRDARIVEWLVRPGDRVNADQPVVLVETEKAAVEIPAPAAGVVGECFGAPGEVVPVGTVLMRFAGADAPEPAAAPRVRAAPSTRRQAAQLGIDLASLAQAGGDRIRRTDIDRAAADNGAGASDTVRVPLRGLRRATALAVTQAWRTIPHIAEFREVDASALVVARARLRAQWGEDGPALTYLPFFVLAVAAALGRHPTFNASIDMEREEIVRRRHCHIGIATATDDGIVVPVLRDADRLDLRDAATALARLTADVRAHRPLPPGGDVSTTITNFGSYGTWLGTPIVRLGEAAIVGFGRIRDAVVAVDGAPAVRPVLPIAVAADHRLNDGEALGRFAATIAELCANPWT